MNKITCEICMDLLPLVQDGVASEDSRMAVHSHLKECPDCRAIFEGEIPRATKVNGIFEKIRRKLQLFLAMVMMFGVFYGMMLTAGNGIFQNAVIMPVIGSLAYYLFRWKGLYILPALLLVTHFLTNAMGLGSEYLNLPTLLLWTGIYCAVSIVGFLIAALLHFVFRKEEP